MFSIGTVNIDTSHAPSFAEILQKGDVARYTCVYNDGFRTDEEVEAFIKRFGLETRYASLDEMAKNVDIAFIQGCDWDRHLELAEPFVKAGVPVFIDKPIAGNLRDCHKLEEWAASGAVILGTSVLRYTYEHDEFFALPAGNVYGRLMDWLVEPSDSVISSTLTSVFFTTSFRVHPSNEPAPASTVTVHLILPSDWISPFFTGLDGVLSH